MKKQNYQNYRIIAENICVDYNGKVALYDANLKLEPGQICGLVGMNGAGKTTFFNALTGFVNISKGKIRINGESLRSAQRDQTIAYVPQSEGIDCQSRRRCQSGWKIGWTGDRKRMGRCWYWTKNRLDAVPRTPSKADSGERKDQSGWIGLWSGGWSIEVWIHSILSTGHNIYR